MLILVRLFFDNYYLKVCKRMPVCLIILKGHLWSLKFFFGIDKGIGLLFVLQIVFMYTSTYFSMLLLQIVWFIVPVHGIVVAVMSFPPQKLLRSDIPVIFFAPGISRQSNAIVKALAATSVVL
jgi:hypothetical protein